MPIAVLASVSNMLWAASFSTPSASTSNGVMAVAAAVVVVTCVAAWQRGGVAAWRGMIMCTVAAGAGRPIHCRGATMPA